MDISVNEIIDSIKNFISLPILRYIWLSIIAGLLILFVLLPILQWVIDNQQSVEKIAEICNIDQTIRDNLDQTFIESLPTETWQQTKAKTNLHKILIGKPILDSDYQIILDVLSVAQKKRLNIGDLEISCNLISNP